MIFCLFSFWSLSPEKKVFSCHKICAGSSSLYKPIITDRMKHIFTVLVCCIMTMTLHSQTTLNEIYREFAHESNVSKVNLNGVVMFFAKPFMEKQTESKISSIRVLSLEDCSDAVKQRFNNSLIHFNDDQYELFISSNEKDEKVRLFLKFKNNKIREMVVMTMGDSPALVQLKGKINLSDIENLRDGRK